MNEEPHPSDDPAQTMRLGLGLRNRTTRSHQQRSSGRKGELRPQFKERLGRRQSHPEPGDREQVAEGKGTAQPQRDQPCGQEDQRTLHRHSETHKLRISERRHPGPDTRHQTKVAAVITPRAQQETQPRVDQARDQGQMETGDRKQVGDPQARKSVACRNPEPRAITHAQGGKQSAGFRGRAGTHAASQPGGKACAERFEPRPKPGGNLGAPGSSANTNQ